MESGLLEQYVLGLTTDEESEEVEQYAQAFPEVRAEIDLLRKAVREYAEQEIAAPGFKNGKSGNKGQQSVPGHHPLVATLAWWAAVLGFVLLGALGIYYHREASLTKQQIARIRQDFQSFKSNSLAESKKLQQQLAFMHHQLTDVFQLRGTELAPTSKVRVYWNAEKQEALLQVLFLPDLPKGNQYQVWGGDVNGEMINLGLIDAGNPEPQSIRCLANAKSLNITLEPVGGSEHPHVDQLYANVPLY